MKIEIAESLCYSWLRHVKSCQIVQTNWKLSKQWTLNKKTKEELEKMMKDLDNFFLKNYNYQIFKKNASLDQLMNQGECDALGIRINEDGEYECYAVDVAFHENGLNYGDKNATISKVVEKCVRTAFCLYGYLNADSAEVVFASPKVYPAIYEPLDKCIDDLNTFFADKSINFCLVANDDFNEKIIKPTLVASEDVEDTNELFIRSYKLLSMFEDCLGNNQDEKGNLNDKEIKSLQTRENRTYDDEYSEMKIGQIANKILRHTLESGKITEQELTSLKDEEYSKREFDLQYPLLVKEGSDFEKVRYYAVPVRIGDAYYYICSQWFETSTNNDRPYLLNWLRKHK